MKKVLIFGVVLLLFIFGGLIIYNHKLPEEDKDHILTIENSQINISKLFIYGTHLNMNGDGIGNKKMDLVFYNNGNFLDYQININGDSFNVSDYINDGIYLDELDYGDYYLFLREEYFSEEENKINYRYYPLKNNTDYDETTYYSFNKFNKKIKIDSENSYPTMMIHVLKNDNTDEIYDIVIDPGHGGIDGGAYKYGMNEADLTLQIAEKVVNRLSELGIKAKITRTKGEFKDTDMPKYGVHGRAVIPQEVHAKYIFSIHLNSNYSSYNNGLEVYTAKKMNYDFAKVIVNNILTSANTNISNNTVNKVTDGIFSRNFTDSDIKISINDAKNGEYLPYDITTDTSYYFIIRETGGIITGAYMDNRNHDGDDNPYYYSNVGVEAYLLELGYMSNKNNLDNIVNNMDGYVTGIVNSIKSLYLD